MFCLQGGKNRSFEARCYFPDFLICRIKEEKLSGCLVLDYWNYSNIAICEDD